MNKRKIQTKKWKFSFLEKKKVMKVHIKMKVHLNANYMNRGEGDVEGEEPRVAIGEDRRSVELAIHEALHLCKYSVPLLPPAQLFGRETHLSCCVCFCFVLDCFVGKSQ